MCNYIAHHFLFCMYFSFEPEIVIVLNYYNCMTFIFLQPYKTGYDAPPLVQHDETAIDIKYVFFHSKVHSSQKKRCNKSIQNIKVIELVVFGKQ